MVMRKLYDVVACNGSELDMVPQKAPSSLILLFAGTDPWGGIHWDLGYYFVYRKSRLPCAM